MNKYFYVLPLLSGLMTAISQILLKISTGKKHRGLLSEYLNKEVLLAYGMFFFVLILNLYIYTKLDYKYGIILNSLPLIFVMLIAGVILKETITFRKLIGNLMILLGAICFSTF